MNILHNHPLEVTLIKYAAAVLLLVALILLTYKTERSKKARTPGRDYKLMYEQKNALPMIYRTA
ncbi:MAG: hypothetical protein INR69_16260 [Mucilaginibacter polytrichastri]|nr:hypothetical protein [Mucilaginibacter polytrichastri]